MEFRKLVSVLVYIGLSTFLALITLRYIVQPTNPNIKANNFDILYWIIFAVGITFLLLYFGLTFYLPYSSDKEKDYISKRLIKKYDKFNYVLVSLCFGAILNVLLAYFAATDLVSFIILLVLGVGLLLLTIYIDIKAAMIASAIANENK